MRFDDLMASVTATGDGAFESEIPESWMQGRTSFGGLTAAFCLRALLSQYSDLPPLRSAQVAFIAPAAGRVRVTTDIVRRGRSATFAAAELHSERGLATRALFCFGTERESAYTHVDISLPELPGPDAAAAFAPRGGAPAFTQHFDTRVAAGASPFTGAPDRDHSYWVRHRGDAVGGPVALLALADMPPPAIAPMFDGPAPISSVTWMVNFAGDIPETDAGWWLVRTRAEITGGGYSSQDMSVWNTRGEVIMVGRQSVALFV